MNEELFIRPLPSASFIEPIRPVGMDGTGAQTGVGQVSGQEGEHLFRTVFSQAIDQVKTTDNHLAEQQYLLATGQVEDPHTTMIAVSEAQLAVDMLVSLRNKALESYNELMRISV